MTKEFHEQELTVPPAQAERRLDQFLAASFPEHSRSFIQRLVLGRRILVNQVHAKKSQILKAGDVVWIDWPDDVPFVPAREQLTFPIIYEDDDLLVVNKPPNMPVHPGVGQPCGTLVNALLGYDFETFSQAGGEAYRPGIVHRLDKDTSGALVVAKTDYARTVLGERFRNREVHKLYLALVVGVPEEPEQIICQPIGRHPVQRQMMAVVAPHRGKEATTRYQLVAAGQGVALLKVSIETGRTHQIRVHMAKVRHPVLGDHIYGTRRLEPFPVPRQMLHAWRLAFVHPRTLEACQFLAPLPADFRAAAAQAGIALETVLPPDPTDPTDPTDLTDPSDPTERSSREDPGPGTAG